MLQWDRTLRLMYILASLHRPTIPLTSASESLSFFFFSLTFISNTCSISCSIFFSFCSRSSFSASSCSRGLLLSEMLEKDNRRSDFKTIRTSNDSIPTSNDSIPTSNDSIRTSNDSIRTSNDSIRTSIDSIGICNDSITTSKDSVRTSNDSKRTSNDSIRTSNDSTR